jgi:hypothetical protein
MTQILDKIIKKDTIFIITYGSYSDYGVVAVCKALYDINVKDLEVEYKFKHKELDHYKVVNWMVNVKKCAEEIVHNELYLGDYGDINIEKRCPH